MRDFLLLLLSTISFSTYSQDSLTIRQVFDFNIGDVFIYQSNYRDAIGTGYTVEWDTLIAINYSIQMDSIYYQFSQRIRNVRQTGTPSVVYTSSIRIEKYTDLDSLLSKYDHIIKTTTSPPSNISGTDSCGTQFRGYSIPTDWLGSGMTRVYGRGLGLIESDDVAPHSYTYNNLVYYHKGNLVCDNGKITGILENITTDDEISIYPNPTSFNFIIKFPNLKYEYSVLIYDISGRKIVELRNISSSIFECNIEHLTPGIYNLIILDKAGNLFHRKVLKINF